MKFRSAFHTSPKDTAVFNEDYYESSMPDEQFHTKNLFVLADGVGGQQAGDVASKTAVTHLLYLFTSGVAIPEDFRSKSRDAILQRLEYGLLRADQKIRGLAASDPSLSGMGTTLIAVHLKPRNTL